MREDLDLCFHLLVFLFLALLFFLIRMEVKRVGALGKRHLGLPVIQEG